MRQRGQTVRARVCTTESSAVACIAPIAIVSVLLSACSVYHHRPDIDAGASRNGGIRYEADLKSCQNQVAAGLGQPERRLNGGWAIVASTLAGATLAGGGATLFHGNVGNSAGMGALVGASAGFSGVADSMAADSAPSDSSAVDYCLQQRGYTVLLSDGRRLEPSRLPSSE
jgi:hypothetical protein